MSDPQIRSNSIVRIMPGFEGAAFLFCMSTGAPAMAGGFVLGMLALALGGPSFMPGVTMLSTCIGGFLYAAFRPMLEIHEDRVVVRNLFKKRSYRREEIRFLSSAALDWTFKPTDVLALVVDDSSSRELIRVPVMASGRFSRSAKQTIMDSASGLAPSDNRLSSYLQWH